MGTLANGLIQAGFCPPEIAVFIENNIGEGFSGATDLVFSANNPIIRPTTTDGSDNQQLSLSGAGGVGTSRGAGVDLRGNEYATFGGFAFFYGLGQRFDSTTPVIGLSTSDGSDTGALTLQGGGDSGIDRGATFAVHGADHATYPAEALFTGNALRLTGATTFTFAPVTTDGSDNAQLVLCGGGANGITRGASIALNGNESTTTGGAAAGGALEVTCSQMNFNRNANNEVVIAVNTVDGTDNGLIKLCGGGTSQVGRGAYLAMYGNEAASSAGYIDFFLGSATSPQYRFRNATGVMWTLQSDGIFVNNATNGGNIRFGKAGTGLSFQSGSGARCGIATLASGNVTISNLTLTTNTAIFVTIREVRADTSWADTTGGAIKFVRANTAAGTLYIESANASDSRTVSYMLVEIL